MMRRAPMSTLFPYTTLFRSLGEMGFLGMMVPEEYGGAGLDTVSYVLAMEEVSRACASTSVTMTVQNSLVCWPLERSEEHTSELQSHSDLVCRLLLEKKKIDD